jgi:hypothetical protein
MMKYNVLMGVAVGLAGMVLSETVTNNLNVQGGFIYNHGAVNPGDIGLTFTNEGIRDITVSAGQLSGVDPETGEVITNSANLLALKAESLTAVSNVTAGGRFSGDGSGLTNLNAESLSGTISTASLPNSGTWDASGLTIQNASLSGDVLVQGASLNVSSNLTVQGTISGNGSGLSNVAAGGTDGSVQFNQNGQLAGNTNFFIHPETGKLAFYAQEGNLFRAFKGEPEVSGTNLIYVLRRFEGTTELCMFKNGVETIRLRGDGSIYATGALEVGGLSLGGGGTSGSTGWFIPEEGDLSMGTFTQQ